REVCPVSSLSLTMLGYFHRQSWFSEKPWEESSSFSCLLQSKEQTWEPVSIELRRAPFAPFQNLMHRSAVPPPVAKIFRSKGHQARALTAAWCSAS
ncbi:hypothetical protein NGA_2064900, partial [Nannochloropsis gaditana CCMP526]|uniref:uncharacterized protein n=1 Tax=Nannochloropsis gaditana (strain CCMP526) TaxID=1093141 RepID=UPI00029F523B